MLTDRNSNVSLARKVGMAILATAFVVGCSSDDNKNKSDKGSNTETRVTPTHGRISDIADADIAAEIDKRFAILEKTGIVIDGNPQTAAHMDINDDRLTITMADRAGVVIGSWDKAKNQPKGPMEIYTGPTGSIPLDLNDLEKDEVKANLTVYTANTVMNDEDGKFLKVTATAVNNANGLGFPFTLTLHETLMSAGTSEFRVLENTAYLNGSLGFRAYRQLKELTTNSPNVKRLVLENIEGSVDDHVNTHNGRLVRQSKLATHVPANGEIASGGVDLFASGVTRTAERGARIGVHSWCCVNGKAANQLPRTNSAHFYQINFQNEILGSPKGHDFYFFTINASSFEKVHNMTVKELNQWLLTTPIEENQPK